MKPIKHVLMIGVESTPNRTTNPASKNEYSFIAAKACAEVEAVAATSSICAAFIGPDLPLNELVRCAQIVRWRWPAARILVMSAKEPNIDDALYDERLEQGLTPELLLASIERSLEAQQHASERVRLWEC